MTEEIKPQEQAQNEAQGTQTAPVAPEKPKKVVKTPAKPKTVPAQTETTKVPGIETVKPEHKVVHVVDENQQVVRHYSLLEHGEQFLEKAIEFVLKHLTGGVEEKPKNYALKGIDEE